MARAYLALGSNLGDRAANLRAALHELSVAGVKVTEVSSFHETDPVGGPADAGRFLNAAAAVLTDLDPVALLQMLLTIEQRLGRVRGEKDAPRIIDLDLLLFDDLVRADADPCLPHPRMTQREFVLAPLAEVAPAAVHPLSGHTIREHLAEVRGQAPAPFRLDGMRALVTGSTSGIGRAAANQLAQLGADVLIHGRNAERAQQVVQAVRAMGRRAEMILADLTDPVDGDRLGEQAWECWNGLDILVNNAGADTLTGPAARQSFDEKLAALWAVDVQATVHLSRLLGAKMLQRGRGTIITIGWDQAETGMEGDSGQLFALSKGAVMAFAKSLAKTLAPSVRVNCVAPGWIKTAWGEEASEEWQARAMREALLARWGTPGDIAATVAWLASPAAEFVTGQVIRVNGGAVT